MILSWRSHTRQCVSAEAAALSIVVSFSLLTAIGRSQVSGFAPNEHLTSAAQSKDQQQLLSELSAARQSLDTHPSAEANLSLGRALKALGESQAASGFLDRALELNPTLAEAWFEKGWIVSDSGDWSKAADLFRHAETSSPGYAPAHLALGEMLLRMGEFDGSRNELKADLQLDSSSAGAHQGLGLIDLQEGKLDFAADEFRCVLALRPDHVNAEKGLARVLASQHKWNEAVALLRRVIAANPTSSEEASALGTALANIGDKTGAAEQFARARELSNRELTSLRAKGDSNWGISLRNEGKTQEAAAAIRRAIDDDPAFCDAHDELGEVLWMQKDLANALLEFQSAVHCNPDSAMARNNLGSGLLYSSHDIAGAIEQFRAALALRPGFALAHLNLGKALAAKQDFTAAESELRIALAIDPTAAAAHINLGLVLATKDGKLSLEAQSEMETGIGLDPRLRDIIPQQYLANLH